MERLLCIVGATATGKTRLSVALAQALNAEIVSFDSMQVYRGMEIGTAAPTRAEQGGVRHHMLGVAEPSENYSVDRYVTEADACVRDILSRGKPVVLVGGTGLYIDALIAGRRFAPAVSPDLRQALLTRLSEQGLAPLSAELQRLDPQTAAELDLKNPKRVLRALEVFLQTGQSLSAHNRATKALPPRYRPLWLGLDYENRQTLWQRIALRTERMFAAGLPDEVSRLLQSGVPTDATSLQAIGYKELLPVLFGERTEQAAKEEIILHTRQYAKRQRTWFRRNESVHWLSCDGASPDEIFSRARQLLSYFDK